MARMGSALCMVVVPGTGQGKEVRLELDFGCEAALYIDGQVGPQ
jgi:hypothetical protein